MKTKISGFLRFKGIIIVNLILLSVLLSCKKEDKEPLVNNQSVEDGITFRDGRLIFKDEAAFINHHQWLYENQANRDLIVKKNKSFGLHSMTEIYNEGMKLEETDPLFLAYVDKYPNIFIKETYDNSTLYMLPHSQLLCYVANKDGIYQVGGKINRIAGNYIYQLDDGDESLIKMLLLPKDQISDKAIKISPTCSDAKGDWAQRTIYFAHNDKYRIVSSLRFRYTDLYTYHEILTNDQHKVFGIWGRAQLNTRSANGDGYYVATCPDETFVLNGIITPVAVEESGISSLSIATRFNDHFNIDFYQSSVPAYSRGRLDSEYIYVYWPDAFEYNPPVQMPLWVPGISEPF